MRAFALSVSVTLVLATTLAGGPARAAETTPASNTRSATCTSSVGPGIPPPASVPSGIPGYHASWFGQSGYMTLCPGDTSTAIVAMYNSGSLGWLKAFMGQVALLGTWVPIPGQDQPSVLGGDGQFGSPNTGWPRYNRPAIQPADYIGPNQIAWFQFAIRAPQTPGTYILYIRPLIEGTTWMEDFGIFWQITVPTVAAGLAISPASANLPVGGTQQFAASGMPSGSSVSWTVTGGCGAVSSSGLFTATATNSSSQPCSVVATAGSLSTTAPITVFGPATMITCTATPSTVTGNGTDTTVVTGTLKDVNGNIVANDNSTTLSFANNAPTKLTPAATMAVPDSGGRASQTYTTVAGASGTAQISVSSGTLAGCNTTITIQPIGASAKTSATFNPTSIAADGSTSQLSVTIQDANGNTVIADSSTQVTVTRSSGATVCNIAGQGSATATAVSGIATFIVSSTTTPGSCQWTVTTSPSLAGSSAMLTTVITGVPSSLAVVRNDSPVTVGNPLTVVVQLNDANGDRITGLSTGHVIKVTYTTSGSAGSGCPAALTPASGATATTGTTTTTAGQTSFTFSSSAATAGCMLSFSDTTAPSVAGVNATIVFNAGAAAGLACSFSPDPIVADGASTSAGTVLVTDANGDPTNSGVYSVSFTRVSGTSTTLVTTSPQNTSGGTVSFTVRSIAGRTGSDGYQASGTVGSTAATSTPCTITTQ
jgi:adhesin/invasin